jgi:hypothetical protein
MLGVSLITKREHTMVRKSFANRMKGPVWIHSKNTRNMVEQ